MTKLLFGGNVNRAVFLDRDGTINVEKDYLYLTDEFEFIPGAAEAIRKLNDAGFLVIVVTNQSGVARGYYTEDDVRHLHKHIETKLSEYGAYIDAWLYCPHHPKGRGSYALPCSCRKPAPGMLKAAAAKFDIDLSSSIIIGDKLADIEAGISAGCSTILVRTGYGSKEEQLVSDSTMVFDDLAQAVKNLLKDEHGI